jgi:hypothetical protein
MILTVTLRSERRLNSPLVLDFPTIYLTSFRGLA